MLFAFLAHHYKQPEFGCCNLWAVCVAVFFLGLQYPYFADWKSKLSNNPLWHRANLFAPLFVFIVLTLIFLGGLLSMLAHAKNLGFFDFTWDRLTSNEVNSFVISTSLMVIQLWVLLALAHTHRNNLGVHYYAPSEQAYSATFLVDVPVEQDGSFNYRNVLGVLSRIAGLETSEEAAFNIKKVVLLTWVSQALYYIFIFLAFNDPDRNRPGWAILVAVFNLFMFIRFTIYTYRSVLTDFSKSRVWNREYLFFAMHFLWYNSSLYVFTLVSIFLQVEGNKTLWDDIVPNLNATEVMYFVILVLMLLVCFLIQTLLSLVHLKKWAVGTANLDDGVDYRKVVTNLTVTLGGKDHVDDEYTRKTVFSDLEMGTQKEFKGSEHVRRKRDKAPAERNSSSSESDSSDSDDSDDDENRVARKGAAKDAPKDDDFHVQDE